MSRVKIVLERERVRGKVLLAGFHGIGYVGWLAIRHLVRELKARRVGFLYTPYMPPYVRAGKGVVTPYEFYECDDLLIFLPNMPLSARDLIPVPAAVSEYVVEGGASRAVLLGGLDESFKEEGDEAFRYVATSKYVERYGEALSKTGGRELEEGLYVFGPLAVMLTVFEANGFPAVALLPYANPARPDPRAAAEALKVASRILGLEVSVEQLREEEEMLRREVEEAKKRLEEMTRLERRGPLYV